MINNIKKRISTSNAFKSIMQLSLGSAIAQLITIIVSPLTTRLYSPEELGIYTLLLSIISIFGPIIAGRYDLAIVTAKNEKEVTELIIGSIIFSFILLSMITIGYSFFLSKNPEIVSEVGGFAYLIVVILIATAIINILSSYNNRYKQYKIISSVYVLRTFVQNVGLILFGLLKLGSVGLLISQLLGTLVGIKKQSEHLVKNKEKLKQVKFKGIRKTLVKYKNQPIYSMPAHFINTSSYSVLNFFISSLFGNAVLGYYSMSYRVLGLPLTLVSVNISKVFFQKASQEKHEQGTYHKTLMKMTLLLMLFSIPMVIGLILFAPALFDLIFGEGWYIAGLYVKILAPMYGIRFVVSALSPALIVSGKQKLELILQCLFIICSITSFIISKSLNLEIEGFLILISVTYSFIYIFFYFAIYKLSKQRD